MSDSEGQSENSAGSGRLGMLGADLLTGTRGALAPAIGLAAAVGHAGLGAIGLGIAWLTDAFDGRIARRFGTKGRLGAWDLSVDTLVGGCLLAGLVAHRSVPPLPFGLAGAVVATWFVATRRPTASMTLQALAYGSILATVWRTPAFWWLASVIAFIAVLDRSRLVEWVLPTFFDGWRRGPR